MKDYRNKKECQYCHQEILRVAKKCPFCKRLCYAYYFLHTQNKKRNKEMVNLLKTGEFTLQQVGEKYGISRERVRQLYKVTTKKPYTTLVEKKQRNRRKTRMIEVETRKHTVSFYCRDCNQPVFGSEYHPHQKIICKNCYMGYKKELRIWNRINTCTQCEKPFHPYRSTPNQIFCSSACYTKHGRNRKGQMPPVPIVTISSILRINNRIVTSYA